jgi:hypothetical protein
MKHLRLLLLAFALLSAGACDATDITASECPGGTMGSGNCT